MKKYQLSITLCVILCWVIAGSNPLHALPPATNPMNNYLGSRVTTTQAYDVEWDDGYIVAVNDTAFTLGWGVNLNMGNGGNELIANGLYSGFNIPLYIDAEAGTAVMPTEQVLDYQEFISSGRNHDDIRRYVFVFNASTLLDVDSEDSGNITGTLNEDGTIEFQDYFVFYIMECVSHYRNYRLYSQDTTDLCSPIFHNMTLRIPNGTHSFQRWTQMLQNIPTTVINFVPSAAVLESISLVDVGGICYPFGHGGLVPKPIDPRKPSAFNSGSDAVVNDGAGSSTIGRMFKPRIGYSPYIPDDNLERSDFLVPVYIHQVDDTTVHVYNLFGVGYAASGMKIYGDGTMRFPGQLIVYDTEKQEDFYNFSYNDGAIVAGNVGTVTPDQIAWSERTYLYSKSGLYDYFYDENVLSFTNGEEFSLMDTTSSTVDFFTIEDTVVSRGDVVDVPVALTIAGDITAFHACLHLSEGFELLGNVRLFSPGEGQTITLTALDDGAYRIDGTASISAPFNAADGVVFYMTIKVPANADGEYRLSLRDNQLTTVAGDHVKCSYAAGRMTVMPYLMGDMDNDGQLDVLDVTKLISKILSSH